MHSNVVYVQFTQNISQFNLVSCVKEMVISVVVGVGLGCTQSNDHSGVVMYWEKYSSEVTLPSRRIIDQIIVTFQISVFVAEITVDSQIFNSDRSKFHTIRLSRSIY